jgi:hypothetical protein
MNKFAVLDFRDELYVKLLRGWITISLMNQNAKFKVGVPMGKAAFVDFLLRNPTLQNKFVMSFDRSKPTISTDDFLYRDNIEFGSLQDLEDFSKTCILLIREEFLSFEQFDGEIVLRSLIPPPMYETGLTKRWKMEIAQVIPLMGKSLNVLHNAILNVSNGN